MRLHVHGLVKKRMFLRSRGDSKMENLHTLMNKRLNEISESKRILLIDNGTNSALATALEREGHHVVHCDCVHDAWKLVYPQRPHLIVFTVHKADPTALSDLHECWALAEGAPIVLATSVDVSQAFLDALPPGTVVACEHIGKTAPRVGADHSAATQL